MQPATYPDPDCAPGFGTLLKRMRLAAGLSQEALAERAGLSGQAISALESGARRAPHRDTTERLARALRLGSADRALLEDAASARRRRAPRAPGSADRPNNLPLQPTSFVGRERELADVGRALACGRLLTITGIGGCGKTRLALRAAAGVLDRFPDGVWLAGLAPLADPSLVVKAVATELGVPERPGHRHLDALLDALRARRLLLVLDNCEHLLDACARLADALLRGCPDVVILATSREALGIAGEAVLPLAPLALPPADVRVDAADLLRYDAVALFAERSRAVRPSFAVADEKADAVATVCRRLDGIPLALELAAARMGSLTAQQLAARLDQRFRLLTSGNRAALPRQQTLQATMDWSYDLLTEPERALLRRLAVFSGGWTLEAAEAVCSGEGIGHGEVLDLLARLVEKSLVELEQRPDGRARYRLLETLRQYGRERLIAANEDVVSHEKHASFYARFAESVGRNLSDGDRRERLEMLDVEHGNLHAALTLLVAGHGERAANLAVSLSGYWGWRHWTEGQRTVEAILALPDLAKPTRAALLEIAQDLALWRGDLATRRRFHEEGLALARDLGDRRLIAHSLVKLSGSHQVRGDLATARRLCVEGLEIARELGDAAEVAGTLFVLADITRDEGDFVGARKLYEEVLAWARRVGDRARAHWQLTWLGIIALAEGDARRAEGLLEEALGIWRAQDMSNFTVYVGMLCLGLLRGDSARAKQWAQEYRERWPHHEEAPTPTPARMFGRGLQELGLGRSVPALRLLANAQTAWREVPSANLPLRLLLERTIPIAREAVREELGLEAAVTIEDAARAERLDQAGAFASGPDRRHE